MNSIEKLTEIFSKFPGIGPRQARRFVYFLLSKDPRFLEDLSSVISELKKDIVSCGSCFRFFQSKNSNKLCNVCIDPNRDNSTLMVVSRDSDLESIEKSSEFKGKYFILGGTVPILEKEPEKRVRLKELSGLIEKKMGNSLEEIILAMSPNPEGENTVEFLKKALEPIVLKKSIKISTLGRGLSTGLELEYSDTETIKHALKNREV